MRDLQNPPPPRSAAGSGVAAYACDRCGERHGVQAPKCKRCSVFGSVRHVGGAVPTPRGGSPDPRPRPRPRAPLRPEAEPITEVERQETPTIPTGEPEFDRVLGGDGIPRGAVLLFSGPPGAGKSTVLLGISGRLAKAGSRVLIATAEELAANVAERAERIGQEHPELYLIATKQIADVQRAVREIQPDLLIVDSISRIAVNPNGKPGSPTEMSDAVEAIDAMAAADALPGAAGRLAVLVVIHVTKAKEIAGAMSVQHAFGGTFFLQKVAGGMRSLTGRKNRFGPDATGYFDMTADGLKSIANPSERFLADRRAQLPGSIVAPAVVDGDEDGRATLVEVQARVGGAGLQHEGRRGVGRPTGELLTTGIDKRRLEQRIAVLDDALTNYVGAPALLEWRTLSVNVPGGLDGTETAMDLPIALAIASSALHASVPEDLVVFGEIGLVGEVRSVEGSEHRLAEAAAMRFRRALAPKRAEGAPQDLTLEPVETVYDALRIAFPDYERCAEGLAYLGEAGEASIDDGPEADDAPETEAPPKRPVVRRDGKKSRAPTSRAKKTSRGGVKRRKIQ